MWKKCQVKLLTCQKNDIVKIESNTQVVSSNSFKTFERIELI